MKKLIGSVVISYSSAIRYPTPISVRMYRGEPGFSSIFAPEVCHVYAKRMAFVTV